MLEGTNKLRYDEFMDEHTAFSTSRKKKYAWLIPEAVKWSGDKNFSKLTLKDVQAFLKDVDKSKYALWTRSDYKLVFRVFAKYCAWKQYMESKKGKKEPLPFDKFPLPFYLSEIRVGVSRKKEKAIPKIIEEKHIRALMPRAKSLEDKALLMTLWESGMRISEFLNLRIKDVEFEEDCALIQVQGQTDAEGNKTGARTIPITYAVPYLKIWKANHPNKKNEKAWLWASDYKKEKGRLSYTGLLKKIQYIFKDNEWELEHNFHHFRKSRATVCSRTLTQSQLCALFGWEQGSKMAAVYIMRSGVGLKEAMVKAQTGKDLTKKEVKETVPCWRCGAEQKIGAKECDTCGEILDRQLVIRRELEKTEKIKTLEERLNAATDFNKLMQSRMKKIEERFKD